VVGLRGRPLKIEPSHWPRVSELLDQALDLSADRRQAWLDTLQTAAPGEAGLLRDLLARQDRVETSDFLNELPRVQGLTESGPPGQVKEAGAPPGAAGIDLAAGSRVGPYQLVSELGHGGMGTVWLAERHDGKLNRRLALKLPHAHLLSGALRPRFERERDILAALSHAHIALLYDAGLSDSGRPYLAMEWVDGVPITRYCLERRLSIDARLALFDQVLAAVAYAHSHLVAHRDLKPSNIMVTHEGQVKLLDFGIAKLLAGDDNAGGDGAVRPDMTLIGGLAVTPDYAAPEQLAGAPVTAAVDVYALGVVLFELLTGTRPRRVPRAEAEFELPLASASVKGPEGLGVGELGTEQLSRALRGDLDAILAKALERDPRHRYASVAAFADDLWRYRYNEPILARRIGRVARMSKFVRRNRSVVALATALVFALLLGSAGFAWQAHIARQAASRAEQQARLAEQEVRHQKAIRTFLMNVFSATDPRYPGDQPRRTMSAGELLEASAGRIHQDLANDPDTEIELLGVVTEIFSAIDEQDQYSRFHRQYMDQLQARYGVLDRRYILGTLNEADAAIERGERDTAAQLLLQADGLIRSARLEDSTVRALWWVTRADLLRGVAVAGADRQQALEQAIRLYARWAPNDEAYAAALSSLGGIYHRKGDDEKSIRLTRQAVDVVKYNSGPGYSELAPLYGNIAKSEAELGEFDAALRDYQASVAIAARTYGPDHTRFATATADYARLLHRRGQRQRALELFAERLSALPPEGQAVLDVYNAQASAVLREDYGSCLVAEGRPKEAIPLLQAAIRLYRTMPLYSDFRVAAPAHVALGEAYLDSGHAADAQRELAALLKGLAAAKPAGDAVLLQAREIWGRSLRSIGRVSEAKAQFAEVLVHADGRNIGPVARAHADLARQALAEGHLQEAEQHSAAAVTIGEAAHLEPDVRLNIGLWMIRAQVLLRTGDGQGALALAKRALEASRRYDDPGSAATTEAAALVGRAQAAAT
jgi:eukaryotic-like serine/threonine-protein kinase